MVGGGEYVREKRYQTYHFIAFQSEEQDKLETQARRPGGQLEVMVRLTFESSSAVENGSWFYSCSFGASPWSSLSSLSPGPEVKLNCTIGPGPAG
jgi:hypothetical protein